MTLLANARNGFDKPLSSDSRVRIRKFLREPSESAWDDVYTILVTPRLTIWQAVCALDPSFPASVASTGSHSGPSWRWTRIPDVMLVARAIREATKNR
jgi:hypothetical protein